MCVSLSFQKRLTRTTSTILKLQTSRYNSTPSWPSTTIIPKNILRLADAIASCTRPFLPIISPSHRLSTSVFPPKEQMCWQTMWLSLRFSPSQKSITQNLKSFPSRSTSKINLTSCSWSLDSSHKKSSAAISRTITLGHSSYSGTHTTTIRYTLNYSVSPLRTKKDASAT